MADIEHIGQSDHDLIVSMFTTLNRIDKTLFGNGQPGLLANHIALKQEVAETRSDLEKLVDQKVEQARAENAVVVAAAKEEVRQETPTKADAIRAKWTAYGAAAAAVVGGLYQVISTLQAK